MADHSENPGLRRELQAVQAEIAEGVPHQPSCTAAAAAAAEEEEAAARAAAAQEQAARVAGAPPGLQFTPSDQSPLPPLDAKIATAYSDHSSTHNAVEEAAKQLYDELGGVVDLVIISATSQHTLHEVQHATAHIFAAVSLAANTSHGGVITQEKAGRDRCLAMWGIRDRQGKFAVAASPISPADDDDLAQAQAYQDAGRDAASRAAQATDVAGDSSSLCWVMTCMGHEDDVLNGVQASVSSSTFLFGSTSADESFMGEWWQFARSPGVAGPGGTAVLESADVVVVSMRPSLDFIPIYGHCYHQTVHVAEVVGVNGTRVIEKLRPVEPIAEAESVPAAVLYNQWAGGLFEQELQRAVESGEEVVILTESSNFPLHITDGSNRTSQNGFAAMNSTTKPSVLLHPVAIRPDLSIAVAAEVQINSKIGLLCGTADGMVANIAVTGNAIDERAPFSRASVRGALFFCCGGVTDSVVKQGDGSDRLRQAFVNACSAGRDSVAEAQPNPEATATCSSPFMAVHPFGEQCYQVGWPKPVHSNLMFGGVMFGKASYGLLQRAHVFLSYAWDKNQEENDVFGTQQTVLQLKEDLKSNTGLICWMDLERLCPGCDLSGRSQAL
eukprot:COSAG02_NODE_1251_length_13599_cov_13.573259_6_plen_613_part_00